MSERAGLADRMGFWAAILTAALAAVSFGVAVTTPPRSGPFAAPASAIPYPYTTAARFVPRDFLWMYPALLMMVAFLVLAVCVRERAAGGRKLFGAIGSSLAVASFSQNHARGAAEPDYASTVRFPTGFYELGSADSPVACSG